MDFKVDSKGFDDFIDKMSVNSENIENNVMKTVKQIAQEIADDAKDLALVDTGHLRENIFSRVVQDGNIIVGEVFSNIEYAAYVEFGTGTVGQSAGLTREGINLHYRQTPWRYKDEEGKWHYTKGQKPQPFLYPAMKNNEDNIKEKLKTAVVMELR